MSTIRGTSGAADATSEALRARVGQANTSSQGRAPQVRVSEQSMAQASASVVYHPRKNEVPADNTYGSLEVWVDPLATPPSEILKEHWEKQASIGLGLSATFGAMDGAYTKFKQSLQQGAPDLAKLDFGFTVDPSGDLVATGVSGKQQAMLTQLLNKDTDLKELASKFSQQAMDWGQADTVQGFGRFKLDAENFQNTIDIGEALDAQHETGKTGWFWQFAQKGEVDVEKLESMKAYKLS